MRILWLTPQLPYPPHQGTTLRTYNLIAGLAARHQVSLLSFVHDPAELEQAAPLRERCVHIETVLAPRRSFRQRLLALLFSPQPDMALRLPSLEFRQRLRAWLQREDFDVVHVEGIELGPYLEETCKTLRVFKTLRVRCPRIVFGDQNAEYLLQRSAFLTDVRQPRRWMGAAYSFVQWHKLRRYEARLCRRADRVVAVSQADAQALQRLVPGLQPAVVPNGVDFSFYASYQPSPADPLPGPASLVFTGKMDFRPNVDAVLWFHEEVWPRVRAAVPEARFYVVGRDPHPRLRPLAGDPAVVVTGYVEDVRPYIAGAAVVVVPIRMGGGTRLKVLEAMAMGRAVVSTSFGCEGYGLQHGRELLIADDPASFAQAVVELLSDPDRRTRLGETAQAFVRARYDWSAIVPRLEAAYAD